MKKRLVVLGVAAGAGLACGALWPRAGSGFANGGSRQSKRGAMDFNTHGDLIGASGPREEALGTALRELLDEKSGLQGLVRVGEALEQLDASGVARLFEQLDRNGAAGDRLAWMFAWWMKRDPRAAAAWLKPRLDALAQDGPLGSSFERSRGKLILAWTKADPASALDYARSHARTGLAKALLRNVCSAWPKANDPALLALLLDFPAGRVRDSALDEFHRTWAGRDPAAAFASAQALPSGEGRALAIPSVLLAWAEKDAVAAFAQYRALGLSDPALLSQVLAKGAAKNPAEALGWLQQLDPAQVARCAPKIVAVWADRDPAAALAWAMENGVRFSPRSEWSVRNEHDGLSRSTSTSMKSINPLGNALEKHPEATLAWLHSLPPGAERDRTIELAMGVCRDSEQALSLFSTLPPDAAARVAASVVARLRDEPERCSEWAMSLPVGPVRAAALAGLGSVLAGKLPDLPPGPDRDALLTGTLRRMGTPQPPAETLARMLEIRNPVLRRDMFEEVMERYSAFPQFAEETHAALEAAAVPEEWKGRWRAR